jgi:hypothetical protein
MAGQLEFKKADSSDINVIDVSNVATQPIQFSNLPNTPKSPLQYEVKYPVNGNLQVINPANSSLSLSNQYPPLTGKNCLEIEKSDPSFWSTIWDNMSGIKISLGSLVPQVSNFIKDTVISLIDGFGLFDIGKSIACLFTGDLNGAWENLCKGIEKIGNTVGVTDIYQGLSILIDAWKSGDNTRLSEGFSKLLWGGAKLAMTVYSFGQANAALQTGRAMINPLLYKSVAKEAMQVTGSVVGKEGGSLITKLLVSTERQVALGNAAADTVASAMRSSVDDVVQQWATSKLASATAENVLEESTKQALQQLAKDGILKNATQKLPEELGKELAQYLSSDPVKKIICDAVKQSATKVGEESTDALFKEAAENLFRENQNLLSRTLKGSKALSEKEVEASLNALAEKVKEHGLRKLKQKDISFFKEIIDSEYAHLPPAERAKLAKACREIANDRWKFSKTDRLAFKDGIASGLTDTIKDSPFSKAYHTRFNEAVDEMTQLLDSRGVAVDESFGADIKTASKEGFEEGVHRSCKKLTERMKIKNKKDKRPKDADIDGAKKKKGIKNDDIPSQGNSDDFHAHSFERERETSIKMGETKRDFTTAKSKTYGEYFEELEREKKSRGKPSSNSSVSSNEKVA